MVESFSITQNLEYSLNYLILHNKMPYKEDILVLNNLNPRWH